MLYKNNHECRFFPLPNTIHVMQVLSLVLCMWVQHVTCHEGSFPWCYACGSNTSHVMKVLSPGAMHVGPTRHMSCRFFPLVLCMWVQHVTCHEGSFPWCYACGSNTSHVMQVLSPGAMSPTRHMSCRFFPWCYESNTSHVMKVLSPGAMGSTCHMPCRFFPLVLWAQHVT